MDAVGILVVIFALAFLVESMTEYVFGKPFEMIPALQPHKWTLIYVAMAVGIVGAIVYDFDLLFILSDQLGVPIAKNIFGVILTGMAIGRGANYIHEIASKFFKPPTA